MKLLTFYSPSHEPLVRRLLASRLEEFSVVCRQVPQGDSKGSYGARGYKQLVHGKASIIEEEFTEDLVFADADVVFLRPSLAAFVEDLGDAECAFQRDAADACAGLFILRYTQRCRALVRSWVEMLATPEYLVESNAYDQDALNRLLRATRFPYAWLGPRFVNPWTLTGKHWDGQPLSIPAETVAFHANWCIGVDAKARLLEMASAAAHADSD